MKDWFNTYAGRAGVLAGFGLAAETTCFAAIGWTLQRMNDPRSAIALIMEGRRMLRLFGLLRPG